MNRFWRTIVIGAASVALWHYGKKYYDKKKGIRTYTQNDIEEIQKNCHIAIDEVTGGKHSDEDIEQLVLDITKV